MRLNKFLAQAGIASRRGADELITSGRITVNGKTITQLGSRISPDKDEVKVDGKVVGLSDQIVTYLLNKPKGVVTTADDERGRKTVLDFVPKEPRVFPCGRLDVDTMGLVVLTNDGNLCYQLTHPKFEHRKEYFVEGACRDPKGAFEKMRGGLRLPDGPITPDEIRPVKQSGNRAEFFITIHEGRNRLVRRMCAAVNIEVKNLTRTKLGDYELGDLLPGQSRRLK